MAVKDSGNSGSSLREFVDKMREYKLIKYLDEYLKGVCGSSEIEQLAALGDSSDNIVVFLGIATRMYLCMRVLQTVADDVGIGRGDDIRRLRRLAEEFKNNVLFLLAGRSHAEKLSWVKDVVEHIQLSVKEALKSLGFTTLEVIAKTSSRLIVGRPSPPIGYLYETGTMFHPLLGIPYIPATSLKGAFRSYATLKGLSCEGLTIDELMGSTKRCGGIVFTDAYPVIGRGLLIEPEVTTKIYRAGDRETHMEHRAVSTPVTYPVVARNTVFRILIGLNTSAVPEECRKVFSQWMEEVLREGIGAKTMVGYGILVIEEAKQV